MQVLITEDDFITRKILTDTLEELHYDIVTAKDGLEAIEILTRSQAPQIVIMDWVMPGMDGIEVCHYIREELNRNCYTYVIMLTGKCDKADIVAGIQAGADDYIIKPFNKDELQVRIRAGTRIVELQNQLLSANRNLQKLADHDHLTGIMNRRSILERLNEELSRAKRQRTIVAVAMADLDHFKQVNDNYGHEVGDIVLQETVRRFNHSLRDFDSVGRYGGEEFLFIVSGTSEDNFRQAFERIRRSVSHTPILAQDHAITITISIGVTFSLDNYDSHQLLRESDKALYQSKAAGRNRITYFNSPTEPLEVDKQL